MKHVLVIPGDGIGPEVIVPCVRVIREITNGIDFEFVEAGKKAFENYGEAISDEILEKARKADAIFFGATTTVRDPKYRSPILTLRYELDLYANVRPARALLPGMRKIDITVIRENTEGLYTGREERDLDGVTTFRRVSVKACERIVKFAFSWCKQNSRKKIVCVHKSNVLRSSDGLFLDIFNTEATRNKKIASSEMLVDSTAMKMVMIPEEFDTIVTLNLYGDILSDLAGGMIGGLGFLPSANIGEKRALFEPAHGSAPDIAGKGIANPFAALLSGKMMLEYLGFKKEAQSLSIAIDKTIAGGPSIIDAEGRCLTKAVIDSVKTNVNDVASSLKTAKSRSQSNKD
jgi:isopropylmalate/isohomocitrate dehydrogenase-like protein